MRRPPNASSADATSGSRSLSQALAKTCIAVVALAAVVAGAGAPAASAACPNEEFRVGPSAQLPDCRAFELVTPAELKGFPEDGTGAGGEAVGFSSPPVLPNGDSYLWSVSFTGLPGTGSSGFTNLYQAKRSSAGWASTLLSPKAFESEGSNPGSPNRTHEYVTFQVENGRGGTLAVCKTENCLNITYVRYPDGSFHLLGKGTVPTSSDTDGFDNGFVDDPEASARWISPDGDHQIFGSVVQLTANAPGGSQAQVYDRTPGGLKLISLLPGEVPPTEPSTFAGASVDGRVVLFKNGSPSENNLFARIDDERTVELASGSAGAIFPGGVSDDGSRAFFVQAGNVYYYDFAAEEAVPVATPGNAILAGISPDGSHAYFISETELLPGKGSPEALNFYVWDGSSISFIGKLDPNDLLHPNFPASGLSLWTPAFESERTPAVNGNRLLSPIRPTPDGNVIVFESYAQLTSYQNEGHIEIYRYDSTEGLACVSCGLVQPTASADSELVHIPQEFGVPRVFPMNEIANLSDDGKQVVFESLERLLPQDVNGRRDVYEWKAGELSLISTGHSPQPSQLFAVTPSGNDIFFETGQKLVGQGQDAGIFAVYDARVDGGLQAQQATQPLTCVGEACQGQPTPAPGLSAAGSETARGRGNVRSGRRCHRRHKHKKARNSKRKHKKPCRRAGGRSSK